MKIARKDCYTMELEVIRNPDGTWSYGWGEPGPKGPPRERFASQADATRAAIEWGTEICGSMLAMDIGVWFALIGSPDVALARSLGANARHGVEI